jgi:hypothetical protein
MKRFLQTLQIIFFLTIASFAAKGQLTATASSYTVCQGSTVTLSASPGYFMTYIWPGYGIGSTINVVLNTPGLNTLIVNAFEFLGSPSTASVNVYVIPTNVSIAATICDSTSYFFNGQSLSTSGTYLDTFQNVLGCDSFVTLNLTIGSPNSYTFADTSCSSTPYTFTGQSLSASGTYYDTLINASGCDSMVTLNLYVKPSSNYTFTDTICYPTYYSTYYFNGQNLTTSGTYHDTLVSATGCDSIITLNLYVRPNDRFDIYDTICEGNKYFYDGITYNFQGGFPTTFFKYYVNTFGCDSVIVTNIYTRIEQAPILATTVSDDTICLGDPIVLTVNNTNNYVNSGLVGPFNYNNTTFINDPYSAATGYAYTSGNIEFYSGSTSNPLYSGIPSTRYFFVDTFSMPGIINFDWEHAVFLATGQHKDYVRYRINNGPLNFCNGFTLSGGGFQNGSQSITVNAGDVLSFEIYSTDNDPYYCEFTISNITYTISPKPTINYLWTGNGIFNATNDTINVIPNIPGMQTYTVIASDNYGCSQSTIVNIKVNDLSGSVIVDTTCGNIPYTFNGQSLNTTGIYYDTLTNSNGCDSFITLNLYAKPISNYAYADTICAGTPYTFNGQNLTASGAYYDTLVNAVGCDSFVTLNLLVRSEPVIATAVSDDTVCQGNAVILSASNTNNYAVNGFVGPFASNNIVSSTAGNFPANWYIYDGPNELLLYCNLVQDPNLFGTSGSGYISSDTITQSGYINFNWEYYVDGFSFNPSNLVRYRINAGSFNLLNGFLPSGNYGQTGTQSIVVNAGDVVTFEIFTPFNDLEFFYVNFTNFSFTPALAFSYLWTGNGLINANSDTANAILNLSSLETYTVTVSDNFGCSNTATASVFAKPLTSQLATTTSSQTQTQADGTQLTYTNNDCDVIAGVADAASGNLLGNTISTVMIDASAPTYNGQPYCRRHYDITPANQGAAVVTLYATFADFLDYNTTAVANGWPPLPNDLYDTSGFIPNVRVTQVHGTGGLGTGVSELITPTSVTWNNTLNAWQITFPVDSFSSFYIHTGAGAPMAINLLNFNGKVADENDILYWTTASETKNDYFELLHSNDEINYTKIATIDSKALNGNSTTPLDYRFVNTKTFEGDNYYQLKMVDNSCKISFSKIVKLYHQPKNNIVYVSPNPFTNNLKITIDAVQNDDIAITVIDATGKLIQVSNTQIQQGKNKINLDASNWASGMYFINVKDEQGSVNIIKVTKL